MTMNERKVESLKKEVEKLSKSLARYEGIEAKKLAKCEKLGCANWTEEDFRAAYGDKGYSEQVTAWFEYDIAVDNVKETAQKLEKAQKRLEDATPKAEADQAKKDEDKRTEELEGKAFKILSVKDWLKIQEEYKKWLEEFKADCLKDGVVIEEYASRYITGKTKSGKQFNMYLNDGWTERSEHCYTLRINGETIFTSGLFRTAYQLLKK